MSDPAPTSAPPVQGGLDLLPFHFAGARGALFGAWHPAAGPARRLSAGRAPPHGHEYVQGHRALRQIAARLARRGVGVLRFDFHACGDSEGETEEGRLATWEGDLRAAVAEALRRGAGSPVAVVGLRLGAAVAARAAAAGLAPARLVLWDPVVTGRGYLAELEAAQAALLARMEGRAARRSGGPRREFVGFAYADELVAELEALDLARLPAPAAPPAARVPVLVLEGGGRREARALVAAWGEGVRTRALGGPLVWSEDASRALVAADASRAIEEELVQEER